MEPYKYDHGYAHEPIENTDLIDSWRLLIHLPCAAGVGVKYHEASDVTLRCHSTHYANSIDNCHLSKWSLQMKIVTCNKNLPFDIRVNVIQRCWTFKYTLFLINALDGTWIHGSSSSSAARNTLDHSPNWAAWTLKPPMSLSTSTDDALSVTLSSCVVPFV